MRRIKEENGDVMIITAAVLTVLIFFAGIATDLVLIYMEHSRLENYCQLARESRFSHEELLMYSEEPAGEIRDIVWDCLRENGFKGDAQLIFYEDAPLPDMRHYSVKLTLKKECPWHFLVMFHKDSVQVESSVFFDDCIGERYSGNRVWHPEGKDASYRREFTGRFL